MAEIITKSLSNYYPTSYILHTEEARTLANVVLEFFKKWLDNIIVEENKNKFYNDINTLEMML